MAQFRRYASFGALESRVASNHLVLVAQADTGEIAGAAEIRDFRHLSMFFVESDHQRQGIGDQLLSAALERCTRAHPDLAELTVHASPKSVSAYVKLGFSAQGEEEEKNGIRFEPMSLKLGRGGSSQ